jgi:hypothetical protein
MRNMLNSVWLLTMLTLLASFHCRDERVAIVNDSSGELSLPTQGRLFRSDWSAATGTSDNAQSDGGKWEQLICASNVRSQVLAVVPGSTAGWTAAPNIMQVTNRGENFCGMVESIVARRSASYFIRMYVRVEDENQPSFHSININSLGDIQVALWAIHHPVPGRGLLAQAHAGASTSRHNPRLAPPNEASHEAMVPLRMARRDL